MMKDKRFISNYIIFCGLWDNEGKGFREDFLNCFFILGRMNYVV